MRHLQGFTQLHEATETNILKKLYNGIMNDHSIQHYSMNWKDVTAQIKTRFKGNIPVDKDVEFTNKLLKDAIYQTADGKLKSSMEAMARELDINLDTLRNK